MYTLTNQLIVPPRQKQNTIYQLLLNIVSIEQKTANLPHQRGKLRRQHILCDGKVQIQISKSNTSKSIIGTAYKSMQDTNWQISTPHHVSQLPHEMYTHQRELPCTLMLGNKALYPSGLGGKSNVSSNLMGQCIPPVYIKYQWTHQQCKKLLITCI